MVQLNLLPDIKLMYIKAARTKRAVIIIVTIISIAVIAVIALFSAYTFGVRGNHLSNVSKDISTAKAELENTEDIDKIITIQNQLNSLPGLHDSKPKATAVFGYLSQLTPEDVAVNDLEVYFVDGSISIAGEAKTLADLNEFMDTLKFTDMIIEPLVAEVSGAEATEANATTTEEPSATAETRRAFKEVVLSSFAVEKGVATFEIDFKFDPLVFSNTQKISLKVPNKYSTRSETEKPIFQEATVEKEEDQ
jgi:hypothetical protein